MEFKLLESKVKEMSFTSIVSKNQNKKFDLDYRTIYSKTDKYKFCVELSIVVYHEKFTFNCIYMTFFEADEPVTNEFKKSQFPNINCPAIAFPFLRSFIATITLNAGYPPVMLPSINFIKLYQDKQNKLNSEKKKKK